VPHALGVKLCEPTYAHPCAGAAGSTSSTSEPSVSESCAFFRRAARRAGGFAAAPAANPDEAPSVAMIICAADGRQRARKVVPRAGPAFECMSTLPRLLRESQKSSRGKRAASHVAGRQKSVPPPRSPSRLCLTVRAVGKTILSAGGCGSFVRRERGASSQASGDSPRHAPTNSFVHAVEYCPMLEPCRASVLRGR
jgi:hypothetical protein